MKLLNHHFKGIHAVSGKQHGEIAKLYIGNIREIYGKFKYTGNIREIYGKYTGNIWEIYGKYTGNTVQIQYCQLHRQCRT